MVELRLEVDKGREATAARFFGAGQKLLDALDSLAEQPTDWLLSELRLGSGIATIAAPDEPQQRPLLRLVEGLHAVTRGDTPIDWNPDTYAESRMLSEVGGANGAPATLTLLGGRLAEVISLDEHLSKRLAVAQPATRTIPGSIRGIVTGVNVSRGSRASLRLQAGPTVRVRFPDALRDTFREALYGFVELRGEIRQDASGRPFHISADALRLIPDTTDRWSDLLGIDPAATDGLPAIDYLRRIRGD